MTRSAQVPGARQAPADAGIFAYGTLLFPEVVRLLLGRVPGSVPARAPGWRVRALPGVVYPGLVAEPGAEASGRLLTDLTAAEIEVLDAYEDDAYALDLLALDGGRRGWAYIWPEETADRDWDPGHFARHDLPGFLAAMSLSRSADSNPVTRRS